MPGPIAGIVDDWGYVRENEIANSGQI